MARGGKRPNAGRKPGAATKKTREIADKAAAEGVTPLEFLLSAMRDASREFGVRMDAAKSAAPDVHARLQAIEHSGNEDKPLAFTETRRIIVRPEHPNG